MEYGVKLMSENIKEPQKPHELTDTDWNNAKKKLDIAYKYYVEEFSGKQGYNPFFYIEKSIRPLLERLKDGDKSVELYEAIENIKMEESLAKAPNIKPDTRDYSKYYEDFKKRKG